jgi:ribosomal protein S18 acetylase RimI-like enzyme
MRFDLDNALTEEILFYMENQDGEFLLDTKDAIVVDIHNNDYEDEPDFDDNERFIPLPEWSSNDGYRLMENFTAKLKNPIVRQELSAALNKNKGVFRSFRNVLEQYPETEKMWFNFKEQKMKDEVIVWYNSLREEWGLEPLGIEPEDNSSLILEDFVLREGKDSDLERAAALHKICTEEREDNIFSDLYEKMNPFVFPGDICFIAENPSGDFCGFISAVKDSTINLRICQLEVQSEYRGVGLGKTLLSKFIEKAENLKLNITIDLPKDSDFFSRTLYLENFKPFVQKFALLRQ